MLQFLVLGSFIALASAAVPSNASQCESIKRLIPSEVILRNDAQFADLAAKNW
jgi:hypothetical protein